MCVPRPIFFFTKLRILAIILVIFAESNGFDRLLFPPVLCIRVSQKTTFLDFNIALLLFWFQITVETTKKF